MFIRLKNGNPLYTGQYPIGSNYTRAVLARINQNTGDTLWVKEYTQPGDTCYLLCSSEQNDSSIISMGYKYFATFTTSITARPFIMKVDKKGNYLWHKYFFSTPVNYEPGFQKIITRNSNDFISICINHYSGTNYQSSIMRFDTMANVTYSVGTTGVNNSFLQDFIQLQDGSYLAAGGYFSYNDGINTKARKLVYNFNGLTGIKISDRKYNLQAIANGILSLQQQADGSIITSGGTGYTVPVNTYYSQADLLKLNTNFDSIKSMYISSGVLADDKVSCSFIIMPDGGFTLAMQLYPSSGPEKFWLVKTDSLGCDSVNCAATVGINTMNLKSELIKSYPNPTSKIIYISSMDIELSDSQIEIRNTLGQTVLTLSLKNEVDVSQLANGCYFITITTKEKQQFHSKFIKE